MQNRKYFRSSFSNIFVTFQKNLLGDPTDQQWVCECCSSLLISFTRIVLLSNTKVYLCISEILKPDRITIVHLLKQMAFQPTKTGGAIHLYKLV